MTLPLSYNWRNLFVRKLSSTLTLAVVAVVVLVLSLLLSFGVGVQSSYAASGDALNILVIKPGALAESTSIVRFEETQQLTQTPGVDRNSRGELLLSIEACLQASVRRAAGSASEVANVAVRGVDPIAFDVHPNVRIVQGRVFRPGSLEAIVGRAASERYPDLKLGGQVDLGRSGERSFTIVGIFEAGGGALDSEIWATRTLLQDFYKRPFVSSVYLRMRNRAAIPEALEYIKGAAVQLEGRRELDYYRELSRQTQQLVALTLILVAMMATGATFAVANTMYAAVDRRRREIAMLRTIGFSRSAIVVAFLIESILLCSVACGVGLTGTLFFTGMKEDYLSDTTYTVFAYEFKLAWWIVASALALSVGVGAAGALAPALRASRVPIIDALRKA